MVSEASAETRTERVDDVAGERVDRRCAANVAALVGGARRGAETRTGEPQRFVAAHAGRDVRVRLALDVELELLVELLFGPAPEDERAKTQPQIAPGHGVDSRH
jgi:hypothetical protein